MVDYTVSEWADIAAPASRLYGLIADYHQGHPRILPRPPFGDLVVEAGGTGAGTVIRFEMKAFGRKTTVRARIAEPEPGRVLEETDLNGRFVTVFTVAPQPSGLTRVTITTKAKSAGGLGGIVERLLSKPFLRSTFRKELTLLAGLARNA